MRRSTTSAVIRRRLGWPAVNSVAQRIRCGRTVRRTRRAVIVRGRRGSIEGRAGAARRRLAGTRFGTRFSGPRSTGTRFAGARFAGTRLAGMRRGVLGVLRAEVARLSGVTPGADDAGREGDER